jgi:hypothetical protein
METHLIIPEAKPWGISHEDWPRPSAVLQPKPNATGEGPEAGRRMLPGKRKSGKTQKHENIKARKRESVKALRRESRKAES